jgi:hypothetical protein
MEFVSPEDLAIVQDSHAVSMCWTSGKVRIPKAFHSIPPRDRADFGVSAYSAFTKGRKIFF